MGNSRNDVAEESALRAIRGLDAGGRRRERVIDPRGAIEGLIADLMHYADAVGVDFADAVFEADMNHAREVREAAPKEADARSVSEN